MPPEESFIRTGGDGQRVEVTDPSEIAEVEGAVESIAKAEDKRIADAQSVLSAIAPQANDLVVEKEIDVAGTPMTFYIKRLHHTEITRLDAKKYRRSGAGQMLRDLELEETVAVAWMIHTAVVKNIAKEGDAPNWAPLWKVEEILGGKTPGMMQSPNPAAQELIYGLQAAIWDVCPATNPMLAAMAAQNLGLT